MKKILKFLDLFLLLMRRKELVNKMAEIKMNFRQEIRICEIMKLFSSFFFARVFVDAISSNNRAQDEISMVQT